MGDNNGLVSEVSAKEQAVSNMSNTIHQLETEVNRVHQERGDIEEMRALDLKRDSESKE